MGVDGEFFACDEIEEPVDRGRLPGKGGGGEQGGAERGVAGIEEGCAEEMEGLGSVGPGNGHGGFGCGDEEVIAVVKSLGELGTGVFGGRAAKSFEGSELRIEV